MSLIPGGCVLWLTGLSGSGKTTLARQLDLWLKSRGIHPVMLDGDAIRDLLLEPAGHDRATRLRIARFNARLCRFLSSQGLTVICPTISMFNEIQSWNRDNIPGYIEIFLDAPIDVVRARDPKGIYHRFERGEASEVVGLDIQAEFPQSPDIRLPMDRHISIESSFATLTSLLNGHLYGRNHS
ncbi:MAG: adenylyl-sulfate kinase [Rhodocyclaceae bacterium]|nr:adenylyl-sulfate kinase [Rhodocyclaceae bacterium]